MIEKWSEKRIDEIVEFNPNESIKKGSLAKKISMDKLTPFSRDVTGFVLARFFGGTRFRNGDTIMARITPCLENGKTAKVDILEKDEIGFGSTEYIVFRAKKGYDPDFIYYLISSPSVREPAIKSMVGSTGRQRVETDVVKKLKVRVPDINEQREIAIVLKSLDDKIAINRKINENLIHQAQCIFSEEFLPLDKARVDWRVGSLLDIADYLNGLPLQKYRPGSDDSCLPVLKIRELRLGSCDVSSQLCSSSISQEYIVHNGDVVFSWSGSLLVDFWCGGNCALNQHLFKVTSHIYDKWFYYTWTKFHLQKFSSIATDMATTMGHIKREELAKAKVLIPPKTDIKRIGDLLTPLYDLVIANRIENRKLASIRDEILPHLITGDLNVCII